MSAETILQFGAGRFLRGFIDRFVHEANAAGQDVGRVVVVQSTSGKRAQLLKEHPKGYPVVVRGYRDGELIEERTDVASVSRALVADSEWDEVMRFAGSPHLKLLVTNATEAGYVLSGDTDKGLAPNTMPGKLTRVLHRRFETGGDPVTVLPCELIAENATRLQNLVVQQAEQWKLDSRFVYWLANECVWLNNLVDCMISDLPDEHAAVQENPLAIMAEPYALLAIERPRSGELNLFDHPAVKVVDDLAPYYLRKVRVLNGVHTAMVAKYLGSEYETVQAVLDSPDGIKWTRELLYEEIVPTLKDRVEGADQFADDTLDRFRNPHMAHRLSNIRLNHEDKVPVRLGPTAVDYEKLFGKKPPILTSCMERDLAAEGL
ncbi:altronate dehydrogenase [Stratiformator vulcanicus]|uniref:Altronate oxidoreductase n=1 Tax=Stratiformator vulcanicus TaxID=2527980 RepID=A0A517R5V4_9PLAN|nr:altronate dehydrogenase [Stratiformator vulcanicus]QDT39268.1 Altronate oxidoreductase [Stratiformator vulcanicus]